jgi:hypothetical protein
MPFASESDDAAIDSKPPNRGAANGNPPAGASGYPDELIELWARPDADGAAITSAPGGLTPPPSRTSDRGDSPPLAAGEVTSASRQPPAAQTVAPQLSSSPAPAPEPAFRHHLLVLAFALIGGPLGILGAITQELQAGGVGFLAAGVIEEALKPAGIYIVMAKWPWALRGKLYTACFSALSGLLFGIIEAFTYVFLYVPDHSHAFVVYRFTVPLVLHTTGSFIFGLGIRPELMDWANGVAKFPRSSRNFFISAMVLHGGFNLVAVILSLTGVLHFD